MENLAQRRSNLKTISPEKVNWYKEIDVTWLYGPIVNDDDHDNENEAAPEDSRSFNTASSVVAGDISIARKTHAPKPILKKKDRRGYDDQSSEPFKVGDCHCQSRT